VKVDGSAPLLADSYLPFREEGQLTVIASEQCLQLCDLCCEPVTKMLIAGNSRGSVYNSSCLQKVFYFYM
jgi:hypothetical protein